MHNMSMWCHSILLKDKIVDKNLKSMKAYINKPAVRQDVTLLAFWELMHRLISIQPTIHSDEWRAIKQHFKISTTWRKCHAAVWTWWAESWLTVFSIRLTMIIEPQLGSHCKHRLDWNCHNVSNLLFVDCHNHRTGYKNIELSYKRILNQKRMHKDL